MTSPDAILDVRNVETYYGHIMAVRGVSLEVPRGEIVTVLGANGAGKTTVLKTISGVLDPLKGTVAFEGRQIDRHDHVDSDLGLESGIAIKGACGC